jgi:hypothetical protein
MAGEPKALLVSYPVDGATIARAWISNGGPQKFLLNDGKNSSDFVAVVGASISGKRLLDLFRHQQNGVDLTNNSVPKADRAGSIPATRSKLFQP